MLPGQVTNKHLPGGFDPMELHVAEMFTSSQTVHPNLSKLWNVKDMKGSREAVECDTCTCTRTCTCRKLLARCHC